MEPSTTISMNCTGTWVFFTVVLVSVVAIALAWLASRFLSESAKKVFIVVVGVAITMLISSTHPVERAAILGIATILLAIIWLWGRANR